VDDKGGSSVDCVYALVYIRDPKAPFSWA